MLQVWNRQPIIIVIVYDVCAVNKIYRNKHKRKVISQGH